MFNLYTYEKQLIEKIKKKSEEAYRKKFKLKRKKELANLSQNYDNRMKNFIYSMCENPIILNKNTNEDIMNKTFNKKKFIFGEYKTEKQRLEQMEAYKNKLKEYDRERKKIDKKRNLLKVINKRDLMLIQPEMKFTSKTKLEKIIDNIKKDDLFKIDLLDPSLLEKIKNNKFSKAKKIKEFYNLIDKEYLNDSDFKKTIRNMSIIEQDAINNKYTFRDYMAWKYYGIILTNDNNKKKNKSKQDINTKDILEMISKEENINKSKNEYDILVKDDFKTHFKGSSQYIEFQELKEKENNKKFETVRNSYKNSEDKSSLNNSIRLALRNLHKDKSLKKEILAQEKLKAKTSRNIRVIKKLSQKKASSKENNFYKILNKNNYSIKDLTDTFKSKKLMMNYLIDKEMDKSLSKEFMKKYNSKNFFGDIVNIPREYDYNADDNFVEIKKEKNLDEKKKLLVDLIINEKRKLNDDYYYKFVKKFSKNIFGFKRKSRTKRFEDNDNDEIKTKSNYIYIDGKVYKKNDIKKISKVIFKKCNYYNKKNDSKESN